MATGQVQGNRPNPVQRTSRKGLIEFIHVWNNPSHGKVTIKWYNGLRVG